MLRIEEGSAIVIDAREAQEYRLGHLPGAVNLPAADFETAFLAIGESLPRDFPLIVYCQGGPCAESHDVLDYLSQYDFQDLFLYPGGWLEWKQRDMPCETPGEEP